MPAEHCVTCGKGIPAINLEFGGPHIWLDAGGPLVCNRECHKGHLLQMTKDFAPGGRLEDEGAIRTYLEGDPCP